MLLGYCVRLAGDPGPGSGITGVDGAGVHLVEDAEVAMWVSDGVAEKPTIDRIRQHDEVVRVALRSATPLPLRYGTRFDDESAVRAVLAARRPEFLAALRRVAGCVEIALTIGWEGDPPAPSGPPERPPASSGREFLEMRRAAFELEAARRAEAERLAEAVERHFADLDLQVVRTLVPQPAVAILLAHLVHRRDLPRYRIRIDEVRAAIPRVRLGITGPWAPYSFV